ncbi:hypothetical protein RUM44_007997 [Polyplax serrata]|uniref:Uncharacterized protein n=1 Tax=Polyplax serrata TaxID=468196 RepID=A0ABR1B945_POLSC
MNDDWIGKELSGSNKMEKELIRQKVMRSTQLSTLQLDNVDFHSLQRGNTVVRVWSSCLLYHTDGERHMHGRTLHTSNIPEMSDDTIKKSTCSWLPIKDKSITRRIQVNKTLLSSANRYESEMCEKEVNCLMAVIVFLFRSKIDQSY